MRAQNGRDIFSWKCFVRYLNNAKSIKCMIYGMNMHHIYHAACAVLKKFLETYLPREAWRLVGPVVSSFPFARHLRRFTCRTKENHHSTCTRIVSKHGFAAFSPLTVVDVTCMRGKSHNRDSKRNDQKTKAKFASIYRRMRLQVQYGRCARLICALESSSPRVHSEVAICKTNRAYSTNQQDRRDHGGVPGQGTSTKAGDTSVVSLA